MRRTLTIALLAAAPLAGCHAIAPQIQPICPGDIILPSPDAPTGCDQRRPHTISYFMDDPGPLQENECLHSGGIPIFHTATARDICTNIDY